MAGEQASPNPTPQMEMREDGVIYLSGSLDFSSPVLDHGIFKLIDLIQSTPIDEIAWKPQIDLSEVDHIDSSGMYVLVRLRKACDEKGVPLEIGNFSPQVLSALRTADLEDYLQGKETKRVEAQTNYAALGAITAELEADVSQDDYYSVETGEEDGAVMVRGDLDLIGSSKLDNFINTTYDRSKLGSITVDLAGVDFIDGSGLRVLLGLSRSASASEGTVYLRYPSVGIKRMLAVTGTTDQFAIIEAPIVDQESSGVKERLDSSSNSSEGMLQDVDNSQITDAALVDNQAGDQPGEFEGITLYEIAEAQLNDLAASKVREDSEADIDETDEKEFSEDNVYPDNVEIETFNAAINKDSSITMRGVLDSTAAGQLSPLIERAIKKYQGGEFVLDMSGVEKIDSSGLRSLIQVKQGFDSENSPVVLLNPQPSTLRLLELTGLTDFFTIKTTKATDEA
jgi:anti-anti-sigma factor